MKLPTGFKTKEEYNAYHRKYRKTSESFKIYHRKSMKKWRRKNGTIKDLVRHRVYQALKENKIKRFPCEVCGEVKVEAHHKDYTDIFKINWLCRIHHRQRDILDKTRKF